MKTNRATLKKEISFSGIGVHSGHQVMMRLLPSEEGRLVFRRTDKQNYEVIPGIKNIDSRYCTLIDSPEGRIQTIEHLLAVFYAFGIDSLEVLLEGEEIPIMDGSARAFAEEIMAAGVSCLPEKKQAIRITESINIAQDDAWVKFIPDSDRKISCSIDYDHPAIGTQKMTFDLDKESFLEEIAPARTFGFLRDYERLKSQGLILGGSLENALVLDEKDVINGPLRFPNEYVRHKILDLVGDLAVLGMPVIAHVKAHKAGHSLHHQAVRTLMEREDCYDLISL